MILGVKLQPVPEELRRFEGAQLVSLSPKNPKAERMLLCGPTVDLLHDGVIHGKSHQLDERIANSTFR